MKIKAKVEATLYEKGVSFTIAPEMDVISHMPRRVCEAFIADGKAVEVTGAAASKK